MSIIITWYAQYKLQYSALLTLKCSNILVNVKLLHQLEETVYVWMKISLTAVKTPVVEMTYRVNYGMGYKKWIIIKV